MSRWTERRYARVGVLIAVVAVVVAIIGLIPVWHPDSDGDGYGDSRSSVRRPWQPDGYVRDSSDCYDQHAAAHPGATGFHHEDRGDGSFDYDCNGASEREHTSSGECSNGTAKPGWTGTTPECGNSASWLYDCDRKVELRRLRTYTKRETRSQVQRCK